MAVSKVILNDETLMDVTQDSVTASTLLEGETATGADGVRITGTATAGGGSTPKTVAITLESPMHASEAQTPACIIYESVDPLFSTRTQIGQIETPTGSATVTTSESCIVLEFRTNGALALGSSRWEEGLVPFDQLFTGSHSFYVFDSGSVTVSGVDYDD